MSENQPTNKLPFNPALLFSNPSSNRPNIFGGSNTVKAPLFVTKQPEAKIEEKQTSVDPSSTESKPQTNLFGQSSIPFASLNANPTNMFANNKEKTNLFGQNNKILPSVNIFASNNPPTNNTSLFGQSSPVPNIFQTNPPQTNQIKNQQNQSNQSNQSNSIFGNSTNPAQKSSFSLSKNVKDNASSIGLFGSVSQNKGSSLFGNQGSKTAKIEAVETKATTESNPKEKQITSLVGSLSQASAESPIKPQNELEQQKEPNLPSVVQEVSSSQKSIPQNEIEQSEQSEENEEIEESEDENVLKIKNQILRFMKDKKKAKQSLRLKENMKDPYTIKLENLQKMRENAIQKNQKLELQLEKLQKEQQENATVLQNLYQQQKDFNFSKLVRQFQNRDPSQQYPKKDQIEKEINEIKQTIQNHYSDQKKSQNFNPEEELRLLWKSYQSQAKRKQKLISKQPQQMQSNCNQLNEIQSLKMFGTYILDQSPSLSKYEHLVDEKRSQLNELKAQNQKKKEEYEQKKQKLREYSPPARRIEGSSSIIMRSIIHD